MVEKTAEKNVLEEIGFFRLKRKELEETKISTLRTLFSYLVPYRQSIITIFFSFDC